MLENSKGCPLSVFFGTVRFFFENKKFSSLQFFDVLRLNGWWKTPKGPSFQFFSALWDFFRKLFSLQRVPLQFLWYFTTHWVFKNPKGSPLSVFRHCETFFRKFVFSQKGSSFNCNKNVDNFGSVPLLARQGLALAGPGAPLSPFFWFFEKKFDKISKKNFKFFFKKSLLRFLSLRYGADFRRSRLVGSIPTT